MLRSVVRRPSPATVIALLVLVVIAAPLADAAQKAVSGPKAQSAAEKKKSTKAVEKAKYADNAGKIRGYSVGFAALPNRVVLTDGRGKLPAAIIPAGTQAGPQGPPGEQGPRGSGFTVVRLVPTPKPVSSTTSDVATARIDCAAGEKITGGGYDVVYPVRATASDRSGPVEIRINRPTADPATGISGWEVQAVRLPPEVAFVSDGAGGVKAQPPASVDKLVVINAWAVCAK